MNLKRLVAALLLGFCIIFIVFGVIDEQWWMSFIGGMFAFWHTQMVWRD